MTFEKWWQGMTGRGCLMRGESEDLHKATWDSAKADDKRESERLRTKISSLESSPLSEEAMDILESENRRLRAAIAELRANAERYRWQPMRTAPKDGWAVLVLVDGSDIPRAARWLRGPVDQHATRMTTAPGWYVTWDGTPVRELDGLRYWMYCPDDPDDIRQDGEEQPK